MSLQRSLVKDSTKKVTICVLSYLQISRVVHRQMKKMKKKKKKKKKL